MKNCLFVTFLVLHSCGTDGEIPLVSGANGIVGIWRGIYSENSITNQKAYEVDLSFKSRGEFTLRHLANGQQAKGTFSDRPQTSQLLINVRDSTISAFKLNTASTYEYLYRIQGREMEMISSLGRYQLNRQELPIGEKNGDGQWYCASEQQGFWRFYLKNDLFWMTFTEKSGNSYFIKGRVIYENTTGPKEFQNAELVVEEVHPERTIAPIKIRLSKDKTTNESKLTLLNKSASIDGTSSVVECKMILASE